MRAILLFAAAAALALPAAAQQPAAKPADRPARQVKGPDVNVVKEAVNTVKQPGECMAVFTVGTDGKPKDIKPGCTPAEYDPFVVRAMATVEYLPEIFAGEVFETEGVKQPFKFGAAPAAPAQPQGELKPAVLTKPIQRRELTRAYDKIKKIGTCNITLTVGVDGVPKDVNPGCDHAEYNEAVGKAAAEMRFTPATRAGQPVDYKITLAVPLGPQ